MRINRVLSGVALFVLGGVLATQMSTGLVADSRGEWKNQSRALALTKECGTAELVEGELSYCKVIEANFRALRGAKIRYYGPGFISPTHPFLDSWVVIESAQGGGGTAFGHCLVRGVPDVLGACQFTGGSGSLQGFKADVTVTTVDGTIWHWKGPHPPTTDAPAVLRASWARAPTTPGSRVGAPGWGSGSVR